MCAVPRVRLHLAVARTPVTRATAGCRAGDRAGRLPRRPTRLAARRARSRRRTPARDRWRPSRPDAGRRWCPTRPRRRPRSAPRSRGRPRDASTCRPSAVATLRPESAAITSAPSGSRSSNAGATDRLPANTIATGTGAVPFIVPPSAGITRSRFEGSVAGPGASPAAWPPSQPGSPELPMGVTPAAYRLGVTARRPPRVTAAPGARPGRGSAARRPAATR